MRVAVIGAASAAGAAVVEALRSDPGKRVSAVVAIARELPPQPEPGVEWHAVELTTRQTTKEMETGDLARRLRGVDALVNVARARRTAPPGNGTGGEVALARAVFETAVRAGVLQIVQLSSFLACSPSNVPGAAVDERWPTGGLTPSALSRSASALEALLDELGAEHEVVRLVRIRAGVVLGPRVRSQLVARAGPFSGILRLAARLPVVPVLAGGPHEVGSLADAGVPAIHHDDLASAIRASVTKPAFGAYNVALDEPLGLADVASALGARSLRLRAGLARRGLALSDRLLERVARGERSSASAWLDVLARAPRLDTRRAREGLDWAPLHPLAESLRSTIPSSSSAQRGA